MPICNQPLYTLLKKGERWVVIHGFRINPFYSSSWTVFLFNECVWDGDRCDEDSSRDLVNFSTSKRNVKTLRKCNYFLSPGSQLATNRQKTLTTETASCPAKSSATRAYPIIWSATFPRFVLHFRRTEIGCKHIYSHTLDPDQGSPYWMANQLRHNSLL